MSLTSPNSTWERKTLRFHCRVKFSSQLSKKFKPIHWSSATRSLDCSIRLCALWESCRHWKTHVVTAAHKPRWKSHAQEPVLSYTRSVVSFLGNLSGRSGKSCCRTEDDVRRCSRARNTVQAELLHRPLGKRCLIGVFTFALTALILLKDFHFLRDGEKVHDDDHLHDRDRK